MSKIKDLSVGRLNNFDFIRFILASLVMFSHVYLLSFGQRDFIYKLTNNELDIGDICVGCFFIISGFFITQSFEKYNNIRKYYKARFCRIYPGLITVVIFTTFIMGPIISIEPIKKYLLSLETYKYMISRLVPIYGTHTLPGVFINNVSTAINGSLWSISPEIWCYIGISILGILNILKIRLLILFTWNILIVVIIIINYLNLPDLSTIYYIIYKFIMVVAFFLSGSLFYLYRDIIDLNIRNNFLSLLILLVLIYFEFYILSILLITPYLLFCFAYSKKIRIYNFAKYGDFSYGIYIYGFFIQQTIVNYKLKFNIRLNFFIEFLIPYIITILFAILSWNLIEKHFIKHRLSDAS
jgi:peptidoglycan/LPS O-acetylase OafA/YrhL